MAASSISRRDDAKAMLDRLLGYLAMDPENGDLLIDTAEAAIDVRDGEQALSLLDRAAAKGISSARTRNLTGLAAMQSGAFDKAAACFTTMIDDGIDDPVLRFNLAWSLAMMGDEAGALAALDDVAARSVPQAAALRVRLLHAQGQLREAMVSGQSYLETFPDAPSLTAAMSVLAIDMGDLELAARYAAADPDHPDAQASLGTLALANDDAVAAEAYFARATAMTPHAPRAWVGLGLAHLLTGKPDVAPAEIDRGAEMFGDHLGSWIAAGWAYFIAKDYSASRLRFTKALECDPGFAEAQGSLAVLDLIEGDLVAAKERATVARRLDKHSFAAALANTLIASSQGDTATARSIVETALYAPIEGSNRTLAQALARLGTEGLSAN